MQNLRQEERPAFQGLKFDLDKITGMSIIDEGLYEVLKDTEGVVGEMCRHITESGGKRVRPLLVLYSGLAFGASYQDVKHAAIAAELIHMASLVHDDVIDESDLRRSRPSVNSNWGNHFAVLCGDYLFSKAFGLLANERLSKNMDLMVTAIQHMCHGEILQAGVRYDCNIDIKGYYEIIAKKTAIFLQCCCKSGACSGNADEEQIEIIGEYGLNLGLAFQIIDDILDFCGDVKVMGKPKGEDLRRGNLTLPVIKLLKDENYGGDARQLIEKGDFSAGKVEEFTGMLKQAGIIEKSFNAAGAHINKAKQCLALLPQSEYVNFLEELAGMLQSRMN